jgi:hypothetical protein
MKPKQKRTTGVLKELIDEFKALPETEQKHIRDCMKCESPDCNESAKSICGHSFKHPNAYGMVSD